jgi:hypothetical protein
LDRKHCKSINIWGGPWRHNLILTGRQVLGNTWAPSWYTLKCSGKCEESGMFKNRFPELLDWLQNVKNLECHRCWSYIPPNTSKLEKMSWCEGEWESALQAFVDTHSMHKFSESEFNPMSAEINSLFFLNRSYAIRMWRAMYLV